MKSTSEIVSQLSKVTKSVWPSILQQWTDDILDEIQDRILNKESAGGDDIIDIISNIKEEISQ